MKPNTALAFVLAGLALVLLSGTPVSPRRPAPQNELARQARRARAGRGFALFVTLIGGLTLCQFMFGWQLGIDELLFKDDPNAVATLIPGRMAPSTAVCFVLIGLALAGIEWEPRPGFRPAELLVLVAAAVSLVSLVEYAAGQPILHGFSQYTRMALHTAVVFLVLSAGVLLARPAQGLAGALRSGRIRRWEQGVAAAMVLALLTVLAGGAWFYHAQEQQVRREVEVNLEAVAQLKVDQIVQWRAERLGDGGVLTASQFFAEGVARWLADPQIDGGGEILARFRALQQYYRYHDVLLVDGRGQVRLSVSARPPGFHADTVLALATAFRTRQPVLTDLHVLPGDPTPRLEIIAPLFAGNRTAGEPIGAVILRHEARQYLYPLIQSWPTPSRSAETLLVRREGDSVLFLNELRHRRDPALTLRIPLTQQDVPAGMAVLGREGIFRGKDYRGSKVLSVLKRIPDTSWFMVAKMDEAEAFEDWRFHAGLIMAVILALVLVLAAAARMIWQQRISYRDLAQSAEALHEGQLALERQNRLVEQTQAAARVGGWELDLVSRQLYWTEENYRIHELTPAHYTPTVETAIGFYAPESRPLITAAVEAAMTDGREWDLELELITARQRRLWVRAVGKAQFIGGRPAKAYGALQDITERKRAEEEIRALNADLERRVQERTAELLKTNATLADFKAALDQHALVAIADVRGRITYANDKFCAISQYARAELLGQDHRLINSGHHPKTFIRELWETIAGGRVWHGEIKNRAKDGSFYWVSTTIVPFLGEDGKPAQYIAIRSDITERKQAEDSLHRANAELAQASRLKDEFLANMSHELRTPLNAILGLSEVLLENAAGTLTPRQVRSLTTISTSGAHLLALINDVLDLSKIEAGRLELNADTVNVPEFCESCLVFVRTQAMHKHIGVTFEPDGRVAKLTADPKRLKQILVNLLTNAVKFTPEGGRIGLAVAAPEGEDAVRFTVWDTGIGIAKEDVAKLFRAFTQIDSGLSRAQEGTGLGLTLVAKLVELHGGSVALESEPGKGSRFTVALPQITVPETALEPVPEAETDRRGYRRALIIEDDATAGELLIRYLDELDVSSVLHGRGEDSVEAALREGPDLILLDILMPDESGWGVLAKLKKHPGTRDIPVVVVSVVDEPKKSRALGAAAHLVKPVTRAQLAGFLQREAVSRLLPAPPCIVRPPARGPRLLLAEDNEANIETIGGYLEDKGYEMHYARHGLTAVQLARELRPALILMDIQMPVMDGLAAIREIRAEAALKAIPIVALTALAMPGDRERCLAAGANDYLSKPVSLKALTTLVERLLPAVEDGK